MKIYFNITGVMLLCLCFIINGDVEAGQIVDESSTIESGDNYNGTPSDTSPESSSTQGYSTSGNTSSQTSGKSTKQVIKETAKDALNSIIAETIRALGENVNQSIRQQNGQNTIQPHANDAASSPDSTKAFPEYTPARSDESRRPKPSRW